jgi:plasmid maintenance system antidote protein VapI
MLYEITSSKYVALIFGDCAIAVIVSFPSLCLFSITNDFTINLRLSQQNSIMIVMNKQQPVSPNRNMKHWVEKNQISQRKLGRLMGLDGSTINGKLNGRIGWQQRDLVRLNELFGLSSDFVLGLNAEVDVGS